MRNGDLGIRVFYFFSLIFVFVLGACTSDSDPKPVCGNDVLDGDDQCDGDDFGEQTCESLGFNGGRLHCKPDCTTDQRSCHNCADDPCQGVTCSDHGRCLVSDCSARCDCEDGYDNFKDQCLATGQCVLPGGPCAGDSDCCGGNCLEDEFRPGEKFCGMYDCLSDGECEASPDTAHTTCCLYYPLSVRDFLPVADETSVCVRGPEGVDCSGEGLGSCGTSCAGAFFHGCDREHICYGTSYYSFEAFCMKGCLNDSDCLNCADPDNPDRAFSCMSLSGVGQICFPDRLLCTGNQDCSEGLGCVPSATIGVCHDYGGLPPGSRCNSFDRQGNLPWDQKCKAGICLYYTCNTYCEIDSDCPENNVCTDRNDLSYGYCRSAEGSRQACDLNVDCPETEVCVHIRYPRGSGSKMCIKQVCDPASADCADTGDLQGAGLPLCWSYMGFNVHPFEEGMGYCSEFCNLNAQCPPGNYCKNGSFSDIGSTSYCWPLDGSGQSCTLDEDCPTDEQCSSFSTSEGDTHFCVADN